MNDYYEEAVQDIGNRLGQIRQEQLLEQQYRGGPIIGMHPTKPEWVLLRVDNGWLLENMGPPPRRRLVFVKAADACEYLKRELAAHDIDAPVPEAEPQFDWDERRYAPQDTSFARATVAWPKEPSNGEVREGDTTIVGRT